MTSTEKTTAPATGEIRDRRVPPRGVLPRQLQTWVMVGLAVLILGIILITGRTAPAPRTASSPRSADPTVLPPDRIQAYQRQLAEDEARLQRELAQASPMAPTTPSSTTTRAHDGPPADPLADERRRREYQSLFADNVAFTRRATASSGSARITGSGTFVPNPGAEHRPDGASGPPVATASGQQSTPETALGDRLLEGTVIETVLLNRLNGTFAGPVECLVTTPVYSHDRQRIVIPAGARVLGEAALVQTWGDTRLAVSFHRLVMPDGRTHSLDQFKGLDQIGETGVHDDVNRHYLQVFGASIAIGALSGLAQWGTTTGYATNTFSDQYRQAAGASLAASTGRVLDRYLNVLPTITIREGYRIKVYLTRDLDLSVKTTQTAGGRP